MMIQKRLGETDKWTDWFLFMVVSLPFNVFFGNVLDEKIIFSYSGCFH